MIGAVVMAAGRSKRMGRPKMDLPWGETTVIGQVVSVLQLSGVQDVIVVTGGNRETVELALEGLMLHTIHNPEYANGEMTKTLQVGLSAMGKDIEAALVVLGDQPQIEQSVVNTIISAYQQGQRLVVPSYQMRRGHPWLVDRSFWDGLMGLRPPETLRDFLNIHSSKIHYVNVDTPSIVQDLDTPGDYHRFRPA